MAKKSFLTNLNNPADSYFTQEEQKEGTELNITDATYTPTEEELEALKDNERQFTTGEKKHPQGRPKKLGETKSKRVHILLKPSTHEKGKAKADSLELSFNEYIEQLIEQDTRRTK